MTFKRLVNKFIDKISVPKELRPYILSHRELHEKTKDSKVSLSDCILKARRNGSNGK